MRLDHAKRLNITPSLVEKIQLYKMTEEVLWADLDRYLHEDVKYLSLYLFLSISMLKMELWWPPKAKSSRLRPVHRTQCQVDPGSLRWPLPPSLPGNSCHQADHLKRVSKGWKLVPEGNTRDNLHQHSDNVLWLGSRGCISGGAQEAVQEDRDRDGLPPPRQHSVQPDASRPNVVHRSVKYLQSIHCH